MTRAWNRKLREHSAKNTEWRIFAMIALPLAIVVLTTTVLVLVSTRPNLADKPFPPDAVPGILTLDWPALYALEERYYKGVVPPEVSNQIVRLPGYMLPIEASFNPHREVAEFLLVPNPGNWLHPAHLDDGVRVRMAANTTTAIQDEPVWIQGRLSSLTRDKQQRIEGLCCLEAAVVHDGTSITKPVRDQRSTR